MHLACPAEPWPLPEPPLQSDSAGPVDPHVVAGALHPGSVCATGRVPPAAQEADSWSGCGGFLPVMAQAPHRQHDVPVELPCRSPCPLPTVHTLSSVKALAAPPDSAPRSCIARLLAHLPQAPCTALLLLGFQTPAPAPRKSSVPSLPPGRSRPGPGLCGWVWRRPCHPMCLPLLGPACLLWGLILLRKTQSLTS